MSIRALRGRRLAAVAAVGFLAAGVAACGSSGSSSSGSASGQRKYCMNGTSPLPREAYSWLPMAA